MPPSGPVTELPSARALVLIGPMGAGKSSIGRKVAKQLGRPFVDTDSAIVREHGSIAALFAEHGEPHFRAIERDAVATAVTGGGVVATGGGAILDARTRALLAEHDVVLLTVSEQVVRSRVTGDARPLLSGDDPMAQWRRVWAERAALYDEVADATFDTSTGRISALVETIARWAQERQQ